MSKTPLKTVAEILTPDHVEAPKPDRSGIRERIEDVSPFYKGLHTRVRALRNLVNEVEAKIVPTFCIESGGQDGHVGNAEGVVHHFCEMDFIATYLQRREVLRLIEASEEFKTAEGIMKPLLSELAELEAQEEADRLEVARKQNALNDALEAAKARALEAAEQDHEVVKAREALEAIK